MTTVALGAGSGVLAALAVWNLAGALDPGRALAAVTRLLAPARAAGRDGTLPDGGERRRLAVTASAALAGAGWLAGGVLLACVLAVLAPLAASLLVGVRRRRWQRGMAAAAAPAAHVLADAIATGRSLTSALVLAVRDGALDREARAALAGVAAQIDLGRTADDALADLTRRTGPGPWEAIAAAIVLHRRTGGDLARLLRDLAAGLDDAARADAEARTASAQARLTARIVVALPVLAAALAEIAAPGALGRIATSPLPRALAAIAVVLQVAALVAVRRIARSR